MERTLIAIKPDGMQRGVISEIVSRFERKGFKLVGIKVIVPSKDFAQKHYHDLKERPFFNGLCDFMSSGPVIAMVWEGEGVIRYGRKLIGQKMRSICGLSLKNLFLTPITLRLI
ncbi:unnamed protein product, partial [Thlaspi arvense]